MTDDYPNSQGYPQGALAGSQSAYRAPSGVEESNLGIQIIRTVDDEAIITSVRFRTKNAETARLKIMTSAGTTMEYVCYIHLL